MSFNVDSISTQQFTDTARPAPTPVPQMANRVGAVRSKVVAADKGIAGDGSNMEKGKDGNSEKVIMDKALQQANQSLAAHNRYVEREIHEVTHAIMYKVKDSFTGEVLFEFPPKKLQDMIAKMWENAGLFIDKEG